SQVQRQGRCALAALPSADSVVAVMAPTDVSWHRLTLPKAPSARLRAALAGMLEESLLNDTDDMHLAVAPQAVVGQATWVAACDLTWLNSQLMLLEKAKLRVDRVAPAVWPDEPATGYFHEVQETGSTEADRGLAIILTWSSLETGVASWTQTEHLMQAHRSLWNLLQFDLTPQSKGLSILSDRLHQFMGPQWRAARMGLVALLVIQVLGLNLWAWRQDATVEQKKADMTRLL